MARPARLAASLAVLLALALPTGSWGATLPARIASELDALASGRAPLDPRIASRVSGYRPGEIPYFVVLRERKTRAHRRLLERAGARILREYVATDTFAVASSGIVLRRVATLPQVASLVPVELVRSLTQGGTTQRGAAPREVDQSRATTADVGAPTLWDRGITGRGVRIAVLDTGIDATHPDLDDLDFRRWSSLPGPRKLVDARSFVGGGCTPLAGAADGHGHGTHVAAIATGTGEGTPLASDDGRYLGIAPDAELAVGKVLSDAGLGLNSDLLAAMEWAAMPAGSSPCAIGADVVNLSLGSESRPGRLNSGADADLVSMTLDRLAARYGTLFVVAAGNSGPFLGSVLEAPGSAAQALSVAASAKDWDVNNDDTLSGDTCAGYRHPPSPANDCSAGAGTQPPSLAAFSSRGPTGDLWLKPDLSAPGYNIVSAQASTGVALAQNDLNRNTRGDPLYATASGTSMAAPVVSGAAALLLQAYRDRYGASPSGASGREGARAPAYALVRAALMNTAAAGQEEARWILTTDLATRLECPPLPDPLLLGFCRFAADIAGLFGSLTLYETRNGAADPYPGPLGEGAGKLRLEPALAALRDGVVAYSARSTTSGTGPRDLQGSWQIGPVRAGTSRTQRLVLHAAPGVEATAELSFDPGQPSDGSRAIPTSGSAGWTVELPRPTRVRGDRVVALRISVPRDAPAGLYTGSVVVRVSNGQVLRLPVLAAVALHDPDPAAGGEPGAQARIVSARDVYAKSDTTWPSVAGAAGTGSGADWLVYPVELGRRLERAQLSVYDADRADETYDLYVYDSRYDLVASTHPFLAPGVTDARANGARPASTPASPQVLELVGPAPGRYFVAVSRARVGGTSSGDFGSFALRLDEVRAPRPPRGEGLELEQSGPETAAPGEEASFELTYANTAGAGVPGVVIAILPAELELVSASAGGSYDPATRTVTWQLGLLPPGARGTLLLTARLAATATPGSTVVNRAGTSTAPALDEWPFLVVSSG